MHTVTRSTQSMVTLLLVLLAALIPLDGCRHRPEESERSLAAPAQAYLFHTRPMPKDSAWKMDGHWYIWKKGSELMSTITDQYEATIVVDRTTPANAFEIPAHWIMRVIGRPVYVAPWRQTPTGIAIPIVVNGKLRRVNVELEKSPGGWTVKLSPAVIKGDYHR